MRALALAGSRQSVAEAGAGGGVRRAAAGQHAADSRGYGVRLSLCSSGAASGFKLLGRALVDAAGSLRRESRGEGWELPGHRHLASTIQFSCVLSQKME